MNADLIAKYDGLRVPRYTSYPTAPHFGPQVDGRMYRGWLAALDPAAPVSLYVHIPFCHQMCWYCGCTTKIVARYQPIADYLEVLRQEIDLIAAALPGRMTVRHLHFGGGTPTLIGAADFEALIDHLRTRFDVAAGAEIAVEIDPRTLAPVMPAAMARAGVTRASLGVQDFNPEVQQAVNRIQPFALTEAAVEALRAAGIGSINLDLMYGLPHQTVEGCEASAEWALALAPERLAVFGYAHVPWMKRHQRLIDAAALPDSRQRWRQFAAISRVLTGAGYLPIGLDHFALPEDPLCRAQRSGRLRRNFQGYTTDDAPALIGLGASSIGALPAGYVQNAVPTHQWASAIREGRPAVVKGITLGAEDRLRRELIESLMCNLSVDLAAVAARHGRTTDLFDADLDRLEPLVADGLATIEGSRVTVAEAVRPMVRIVAAAFDPYLAASRTRIDGVRHAQAI